MSKGRLLLRNGFVCGLVAAALCLLTAGVAQAQSLRQGIAAFNRQDYVQASAIFTPTSILMQPRSIALAP